MGKYDELTDFILKEIGGKENVTALTHCMTRLRFTLKDNSLVDREKLTSHPKILTAQISNNQYQVVVGTAVGEICQELLPKLDLSAGKEEGGAQIQVTTKKTILNRMIDTITKVITPILGVLMGCSLVLGLQSVLVALGVLQPGDGAYSILNAIGNSLFTFLPIILGYTSARAFGSDGFIGMIIGAALVFPSILTDLNGGEILYTLFAGTPFQTDVHTSFFGIPVIFPETGYTSTVIPVILAMFFISKLEHFFKRHIPKSMEFTFVPFLTVLVGVTATILVFGPVADFLSSLITLLIEGLYGFSPLAAAAVVGFTYTPLVILGLHWPMITIGINNLATLGSDFLMPMIYTVPVAQMGVVLAVYMKSRKKEVKELCFPAVVSAFFCIIEPSIYGITLPVRRRFIITCLGSMLGALIIAGFHVVNYASTIGILGMVGFINPHNGDISGMRIAAAATLAVLAFSFLAALFTEKE